MLKVYFLIVFSVFFALENSAQRGTDLGTPLQSEDHFKEDFILIDSEVNRRATITTPPSGTVRPMAEWEEIEAIVITWDRYKSVFSEIVKHAQKECKVYINCRGDASEVKADLDNYQVSYSENVIFLENQDFNSVWIRDYGPNSAYKNDVDSLIMVDWVYNRSSRPDDDVLPAQIADALEIPLYETAEGEHRLTATGGNFMNDGIKTGFSSKLVLSENSDKTEDEIDKIMSDFLGVENYIKFDTLVYDGIHHIDMHMKLLDEERIMFGQYPEGKADHEIIEANIEYLLATKKNAFGEPYEIIRMPMPPDGNEYPGDNGAGLFKTYTNALFINKTILVPTYESASDPVHDTEALRIWQEAMPGYNIVGIRSNNLIDEFGAIHCITKEIGARDPIRIVFQKIKDQEEPLSDGYPLIAKVQHRYGIDQVNLFYREAGEQHYDFVEMDLLDASEQTYRAAIPSVMQDGTIEYFVEAIAKSGKTMYRPQPAPAGYYDFDVKIKTSVSEIAKDVFQQSVFPNPSSQSVSIPVHLTTKLVGELSLVDIHGRVIETIHTGIFPSGESTYITNVSNYPSGIYTIKLSSESGVYSQKIVVCE